MGSAELKQQLTQSKKQAGFTLVELIAVVGIISMIAIYITIEINQSSDDAKVGLATAFLVSNVPNALSSYRARHLGSCLGIAGPVDGSENLKVLNEGDNLGSTPLKQRLLKRGLADATPWGDYWNIAYDSGTREVTLTYPVPGTNSKAMIADIVENLATQGQVVSAESETDGAITVVYNCS